MAANIICKSCGNVIEISEALTESIVATERLKYQKTELELRRRANELEEKNRNFELTLQRQLDEERNKIRLKAAEEIAETQRLKDLEKDKMINDLKKSLEDAQRKATQGSQQLQGEIQELDLEESLKINFPGDEIIPIAKGVNGADIKQIVKSPNTGVVCGSILWESKRTKAWSDGWIIKLKEDLRADKSNVAAIVSEIVPAEIKPGIGSKDGVWICTPKFIVPLGMLLAKGLRDAAYQRLVSQNQSDKAQAVYAYFTSHEFTSQVESMVESINLMREQIAKEKMALEKIWSAREAQIGKLSSGISGVYGSLSGIAGNALPEVKLLELE
ncbi:DUF2130 domain-containing protein [Candidatus Amesbacteria bacterium]|nr:DUF2130 domain-containing protein [Candidatus Amesbacteria bacterium]